MAEQIAVLLLALVFPGAGGTIAELFLLLTDLADDMRGSKAMCMQVVKRVEFLYQHVESIQSTRVLEHNDVLPKLATTITSFLDLMKRHSRKHSFARYLARHDVAADIAAFHSDLDAISLALNLTTAAEIAELRGEFKENQKKDAKVSCEILSNTRALMDEYRGRGLREVIHDMQFAIQKSSDPAKSGSARLFADDIKLMQRTMDAMVKQYGVQLGVLPPWYVPSDEVCCLEEHFATGTYGSVHRATWKGTRVVVKKLLVPVDESIERDFQREMTIWHEVNNHPHIIELYGGCHVATPPFFVCADATGGNFADHFRDPDNKRRFLWRRFHEAALGLTHLHTEKKVVHGDLKCRNLLVGADGKTKICDFGFSFIRRESRAISVKAQTDAVRWKALECAMGEEHTPQNPQFKSDVYSLGMCIIEAVSGSEPWTGLSDEEIFDNLESGKRHARPDGFTDKQWQLVEAMTAIDVMARMSLDKALAMLERLADDEEALYPSTLVCPTCRVESPGKSKFCSECAHSFIDSNARAAAAS